MLWSVLSVLLAIVGLGVLVLVHEFGHFVAAKLSGISVATFSIGFGKPLWKREIGMTQYQIAPIFCGGYVEMIGQSDTGEVSSKRLKQLEQTRSASAFQRLSDPKGWFCNRPGWAQLAVAAGGPAASFLLTIVIMTAMLSIFGAQTPIKPPTLFGVIPNSPAGLAGMQPRDQIVAVDGRPVKAVGDVMLAIAKSGGSQLSFRVLRDERELSIAISPAKNPSPSEMELPYQIGVRFKPQMYAPKDVNFLQALWESTKGVGDIIGTTAQTTVLLIKGDVPFAAMSGPVGMVNHGSHFIRDGLLSGLIFLAFLSTALGATQLIPFPPLDGSHIVFASWKMLTGRAVSPKVEGVLTMAGFLIVFGFMIAVTAKDLFQLTV